MAIDITTNTTDSVGIFNYIEFLVDGVRTEPESMGEAQLVYAGTLEPYYKNAVKTTIGEGYYAIVGAGPLPEPPKSSMLQAIVKDVKFPNRPSIPIYFGGIFKIFPSQNSLEEFTASWAMTDGASIKYSNYNSSELDNQIFRERPYTAFYEEDDFIYTQENAYADYIPNSDIYIFPAKAIWSSGIINTGLLDNYKENGKVGALVPATYLYDNYTSSGFAQEAFELVSGLGGLQYSTSGNLIYQDENKAVFSFWDDTVRNSYINLVNSYSSDVDFVFYESMTDFNNQLSRTNSDPLLDYDTFGYDGDVPFTSTQWAQGLYKLAASGVAGDAIDLRKRIGPFRYKTLYRVEESPATYEEQDFTLDTQWDAGEIWEYVQRVYNSEQPAIISYAYKRDANDLDHTLGKALALLTDSYFSPGRANFSEYINYSPTQYSKYLLGDPLGAPTKESYLIKREFINGWVEVDDVGNLTLENVRINLNSGDVEETQIIIIGNEFTSLSKPSDQLYDQLIATSGFDNAARFNLYTLDSDTAYNNLSGVLELDAELAGVNDRLLLGAELYYTNWPESLWSEEYNSGLSTAGSVFYPILSGQPFDSNAYRTYWYNYINYTDLDYYLIKDRDSNLSLSNVTWLTSNFGAKKFLFETNNTSFPHNRLIITGISEVDYANLKNLGKYVWTNSLPLSSEYSMGYYGTNSPVPIEEYRLSYDIEANFGSPEVDQPQTDAQYADVLSVNAPAMVTAIDATAQTVTSGTNWPEGTYEMGFYNSSTFFTGPNPATNQYFSARPRVRRIAEFNTGMLLSTMGGFPQEKAIQLNLSGLDFLADYEQIFKDPVGKPDAPSSGYRTGPSVDGSMVSWYLRPGEEIPNLINDQYGRFIAGENGVFPINIATNNYFATGRFLEWGSKLYHWLIAESGLDRGYARVLSPMQIAVHNIVNKGAPLIYPTDQNAPEFTYTDPFLGFGDSLPNGNYYGSAILGLCGAYNVKDAMYLVDANNANVSGLFTTPAEVITGVSNPDSDILNLSEMFDNSDLSANGVIVFPMTSGNTFDIGRTFTEGDEKFLYQYEIGYKDTITSTSMFKEWDLMATNHPDAENAPDEYWKVIDYRQGQALTPGEISTYNIYNPALFRTFKFRFYNDDDNLKLISHLQINTADKSEELAITTMESGIWSLVNAQDTDPDSPLFGHWYTLGSTDTVGGQEVYRETITNYFAIVLGAAIKAYTVAQSPDLRERLRYSIRLGLDKFFERFDQNTGQYWLHYIDVSGLAIPQENTSLHREYNLEHLGLAAYQMKAEPQYFDEVEWRKIENVMDAVISGLGSSGSRFYMDAFHAHKLFKDSLNGTTNSGLLFKLP